ncbi:ROK family transcriptional regulator [Paenibacillus hemerocallicola]|uniref:ROK family transcriptional regulator n=1 Tax=Paenibacillus hemerocallicola TaxID=1172614 RepID=A0A5C4TDM3_9BACL|nr:ROK family transcriptional regulator [Paenibacillus hemerocallicola]TNJ66952.1 ROK family transcriptional regulator [Paenibacillus hemerocallicola]
MLSTSEILVLTEIQKSEGISRKALAEKTGLSQASLTKITHKLVAESYITEGERIGSGLGRKEVLLTPNPDKFKFLGIDIGGYRLRLALANYRYELIRVEEYLIGELEDKEDVLGELIGKLQSFLEAAGTTSVDAIGVSVTGIIDIGRRTILNIPNLDRWNHVNIVEALSNRFACPVYLEESGRTMAYAEKLAGKAKDAADFIVVHVAYGVVAGIYTSGEPLRGAGNVGGLLGHITADEKGIRCRCGNYGCLENVVTFPMLEGEFRRRSGGSSASLAEAYGINDKDALDVCIGAGKSIGIALSNVVNLFNPETIYLGGPVFERFPIVFEEVRRTVLLRANRFATVGMTLDKTTFGDRQGLLGALTLAGTSYISSMEK